MEQSATSTLAVNKQNHLPAVLFTAVAGLILALLLGLFAIWLWFRGSEFILPGVSVGGLNVSGMRYPDAAVYLDQALNQTRSLTVTDGLSAWPSPAADFGLWVDTDASLKQAQALGRGSGGLEEIWAALNGKTWSFDPPVYFNEEIGRAQLERWTRLTDLSGSEAELVLSDQRWVVNPASAGRALDVDASLAQLKADPGAVLRGGVLALAVRPTGGQTDPRLESLAARLNTLLAAPLQFEAFDPITGEFLRWQAPVEQAAGWLRPDLSGAAYSILVDRDALAAYLAEYSAGLGPERKLVDDALPEDLLAFWEYGQALELEVYHNPTRLVVQAGDTYLDIAARVGIPYWRIQNANPGVTLRGGLEITIPSKNDLLPLPVVRDKRIVISISDQHLWAYENGELRSESVISTGMASSPTMAGVFQVQSHIKNAYGENWDLWMPDFMGIYEAVPGFWNGIHGLPLLHNGVRLWGNVLGRPASYGCIILTLAEGEDLYNWAEDGVVVEIRR